MAHGAYLHKVYKALSTKFRAWALRSRSGVFRLAETSLSPAQELAGALQNQPGSRGVNKACTCVFKSC